MTYNRTMTATTYVADRKNKRILLHLHKKFGCLYPLGGHIEPHELPHEAALREVFEESGLNVILTDINGAPLKSDDPFILPCPALLLHENTSKPIKNLDFVYFAFLHEDTDPNRDLRPGKDESTLFFWASADEISVGRVIRCGKEYDIPPHIKGIAEIASNKLLGEEI